MSAIVRAIALMWRIHQLYPSAPIVRVVIVSYVAVRAETRAVPAELLVVIAEHESDLRPRAVSWRHRGGKRVDKVVDSPCDIPERGPMACGLVQTIARDRAGCVQLLDPTAAMAAGAAELTEELHACRGAMFCALSIYAGGGAGRRAWAAGESTQATVFAAAFHGRARRLGWSPR